MSRSLNGSPPSYRFHKARGCAVVTIDGRNHYLGTFGTPASRQKYAALIRAWEQRRDQPATAPPLPLNPDTRPTINNLVLVYLKHARDYYRPNHGENKEAGCISDALAVLEKSHARELADEFRPKDLKQVREAMMKCGWSRQYINRQVARIKRMFAYAAEEDLISGSVYHALLAVKGLRKNTQGVTESKRVRPVPLRHIVRVLKSAPVIIGTMIRFAYYTGARPNEVCALQPRYIDRSKDVWVYAVPPEANKTEHHDQDRQIFIGPRAQKVLAPLLVDIAPDDHVFSPAQAEAIRNKKRRDERKSPLWTSHLRHQTKKKAAKPRRAKRNHYDPSSFRRAVKRLCDLAKVPQWSPNQLRHNAGTRFRQKFGLEVARVLLGHRKMNTTEIYAEIDHRKAKNAASCEG